MTIFSNSSVSTGSFSSFSFDGVNGVAGSGLVPPFRGLWYSSNSGASFTQSNFNSQRIFSVSISGTNAVATSYNADGLYYSTNSGQTWANSNITSGDFYETIIKDSVALAGSAGSSVTSSTGIYRSTDGGQNWSIVKTNDKFICIYLSGSTGSSFAVAGSDNFSGLWYSLDAGANWTVSNVTSGNFESISFVGDNGIASSSTASNNGLWYTTNKGQTWTNSNISSGGFYGVSMSGTFAIAGSDSNGLYYSSNSGQNWVQSNITTGLYFRVFLSGTIGIAGGLGGTTGIYTTGNRGQTWTLSTSTTNTIRGVYIVGTTGLAGSNVTTAGASGIWVNTSPLCYGENTRILCLIDDEEKYVNIGDITVGTLVKTYKCGYKPVKYINSFDHTTFNKSDPRDSLYSMIDSDLVVTGGHSILVDELTQEENANNLKFGFSSNILDKKLLLACFSDKFKLLDDNKSIHKLYHLVLENEDVNGQYGIYVNDGILTESCDESHFQSLIPKTIQESASQE